MELSLRCRTKQLVKNRLAHQLATLLPVERIRFHGDQIKIPNLNKPRVEPRYYGISTASNNQRYERNDREQIRVDDNRGKADYFLSD